MQADDMIGIRRAEIRTWNVLSHKLCDEISINIKGRIEFGPLCSYNQTKLNEKSKKSRLNCLALRLHWELTPKSTKWCLLSTSFLQMSIKSIPHLIRRRTDSCSWHAISITLLCLLWPDPQCESNMCPKSVAGSESDTWLNATQLCHLLSASCLIFFPNLIRFVFFCSRISRRIGGRGGCSSKLAWFAYILALFCLVVSNMTQLYLKYSN